jgi:uncharacterized membrane protein
LAQWGGYQQIGQQATKRIETLARGCLEQTNGFSVRWDARIDKRWFFRERRPVPDQISDSSPTLLAHPFNRWLVRLCSFSAAVLCGYLYWQKLNGSIVSLSGCGQESGCTQVLGGRWSQWMGVPVSLLAAGFYFGVFLLSFEFVQRWFSIQADRLLAGAAVMAIFCALWFVGLLWIVERAFCPYCAVAHGLGIVFAIPVLHRAWRFRGREAGGFFASAFSVALPAFLILIAGQVFGPRPDTHQIVEKKLTPQPQAPTPLPGNLAFFGGALTYPVAELPRIGEAVGQFHLVEYADYTCASCRDMSGDLEALFKAFPGKFTITVLPCPLNRQCNPYCGPKVVDHPGACELAVYALTVWQLAPSEFPAYHHYLMHLPFPVDVAAAKARAEAICGGPEALNSAETVAKVQKRLTITIEEYRLLAVTDPIMPKLLLQGSRVMNGPARDVATFLEVIRQEFKLAKP